ncbi:RNA-directed DNA polymerase, eukaryota [Tanacetum coccineum]
MLVANSTEVCQTLNVDLNGKLFSVRIFEERFQACLVSLPSDNRNRWDLNVNHENESESEVWSDFEEEFIGPSLVAEDSETPSDEHQASNVEVKESTQVYSPSLSPMVSYSANFSMINSFNEETVNVSLSLDHGCAFDRLTPSICINSNLFPNVPPPCRTGLVKPIENDVHIGPQLNEMTVASVPDLNIHIVDEEKANDNQSKSEKRRKSKHRKNNLVLGSASCPPSLVSQSDDVGCVGLADEECAMKIISVVFVIMIGISVNYNGLGVNNKRSWIMNLIEKDSPNSAIGALGGILIMWSLRFFSAEQNFIDRNFLCILGSWVGVSMKVGLINVYAPQSSSQKVILWASIESLINSMEAIWVIYGDFNVVRNHDERLGSYFDESEANAFNDFISQSGLFNFPLGGRRFTRFSKDVGQPNFGPKSFKVFDMWIGDDGFLEFVSNAWAFNFPYVTPDLMLKNKLKSLRLAIKTCTSDQIMAQKQYANFNIKGLHFDEIWCESPDLIKQAVAGHFSSRFKEGNKCRPTFSSSLFQRLSVVDANFLEADISMDEIKSAVWDWGGCVYKVISKILASILAKVDFEMNFDSVNWNFLHDIMRQMGFGEKWRKWIDACLSSAFISVMVNGSPSKEFKMERGLRQGDPLSLFLFPSGLKVNLCKSRLFRIGIPNIEVQEVASLLGCIHDSLPFAYPGLLVGKKMRFCDRWNDVINHFRERLSAWKARALSIGGRLTLVKSILGSLPIYYLSLFKAPKKKEALWRIVIKGFYGDSGGFESLVGLPRPNGIWCDILKAVKDIEIINPSFKRSFHIKVLDGANVSFWKDPGVRIHPPQGRTNDGVIDLVSMIGNLSLSWASTDRWSWSKYASGIYKDRVDDIKQEDIFPSIQRISKIWISTRASSRPANWNCWIARPFDLFGVV